MQVDVKFLQFRKVDGRTVKRYQPTAIDDATRIRALGVSERHNQENAIDFIDHVIAHFPFRIDTIRTNRGHEFQAKSHWHVEDLGMRYVYIRPRSPNLNGKVQRTHLTDELEFYRLLTYTDDVDLRRKLARWEKFYNVHRPHAGLEGLTPYEAYERSWYCETVTRGRAGYALADEHGAQRAAYHARPRYAIAGRP